MHQDIETIINLNVVANYLIGFLNVLFPVMLGAYAKELHQITTKRYKKVSIQRLLLSGIVPTFIMSAFIENIIAIYSYGVFMLICVAGGMVGMQLFEQISTLEKLKQLIQDIKDFKDFKS